MTIPGIWTKGDDGWMLSRPKGFPDEATLHRLIEDRPDMLPLAGAPRLVILGSEVGLGARIGGPAWRRGVGPAGHHRGQARAKQRGPARRRCPDTCIRGVSAWHDPGATRRSGSVESLQKAGHATIPDAVTASEQGGAFDHEEFTAALDRGPLRGSVPAGVRARRRAAGVDDPGGLLGARHGQAGHRPGGRRQFRCQRHSRHDPPARYPGATRSGRGAGPYWRPREFHGQIPRRR